MMNKQVSIAVLGAGSWGTALALVLANNPIKITLWGYDPAHVTRMLQTRCNDDFLPDHLLPDTIQLESDLARAIGGADGILIAVPSHGFPDLIHKLAPLIKPQQLLAWATKGLDPHNGELLHTIVEKVFPQRPFSILSGPSFAKEVANQQPTAITLASLDDTHAKFWQQHLHSPYFRVYTSHDIIGVQIGGAVKNVIAIAVGIADGSGFGANARAALMTRGLAEMQRLGQKLGAQPLTLMGLSGVGDLILTCTDNQSRNRRFGLAVGQGESIAGALEKIQQVVEGYHAAQDVWRLAQHLSVSMPIIEEVHAILYEQRPADVAVKNLLFRDPTVEYR